MKNADRKRQSIVFELDVVDSVYIKIINKTTN